MMISLVWRFLLTRKILPGKWHHVNSFPHIFQDSFRMVVRYSTVMDAASFVARGLPAIDLLPIFASCGLASVSGARPLPGARCTVTRRTTSRIDNLNSGYTKSADVCARVLP
jgi:hypothetical protein